MHKTGIVAAGLLSAIGAASAAQLTVFEQGAAVVTETRELQLAQGKQSVGWANVPETLLPETLLLGGDKVEMLGSRFLRDALGSYSLLSQSVGDSVTLLRGDGAGGDVERKAQLISANGPLVRSNGRYEIVDGNSPWRIAWTELPSGQPENPGLTLELSAAEAGKQPLALTYQVNGLRWAANYVGRYDAQGNRLTLRAQATINNEAGHFQAARLSLISGQIARESGGGPRPVMMRSMAADSAEAGVQASPSFEYYRYDLPQPVDMVSGETRNVTLFSEAGVAVEQTYVIEGGWRGNGELPTAHPEIRLDFENTLEKPLPAGSVRIYDGGQPPMLLGEDRIQHTAQDGHVTLALGRAFDIQAERRVTEETHEGKTHESSRRITISNAKKQAVQVRVIESLPGEWEVLSQNLPHERLDAHRVVWVVGIPAQGKASLIYQVKWR